AIEVLPAALGSPVEPQLGWYTERQYQTLEVHQEVSVDHRDGPATALLVGSVRIDDACNKGSPHLGVRLEQGHREAEGVRLAFRQIVRGEELDKPLASIA